MVREDDEERENMQDEKGKDEGQGEESKEAKMVLEDANKIRFKTSRFE